MYMEDMVAMMISAEGVLETAALGEFGAYSFS